MREIRYDLSWLENPEIVAVGRMKAVSDHDIYLNAEELSTGKSSLHACLSGRWRFHYAPDLTTLPEGFWKADFDASGWDEIAVPGHMQLQGYGRPQYIDVQYPWDGAQALVPPQLPKDNPTGSYVRRFTLPEAWKGMRVVLTFLGVEAAFFCWVNGRVIGYAEDGFTPSSFDITDALREGENTLAVQVYHYASCSWLEDQDFWRFSGIFRDVILTALPEAHVEDIFVHTDLTEDFAAAELRAVVKLSLPEWPVRLRAVLKDSVGCEVCALEQAATAEQEISMHVDAPGLWSAESPELYRLELTLFDDKGEIEAAATRVGFRKFEIKAGIMLLNGKRILLRGVNRHEFSPYTGRCITEKEMLADVVACKRNNINAVRTSHYPNQSLWYRLCDEYGIYLIDEANVESHGTWALPWGRRMETAKPGDDPDWLPSLIDRATSMQERDKNHPSVLMWSCGNESGGGRMFFEMAEHFRRRDPSRIVHYEGVCEDRRFNDTSDVESRMYVSAERVSQWLDEHCDKPYILCEYSHAMGNSCGALHKYLALEDKYRQYQGGFIWDFIDQALAVTAPNGRLRFAYGGDMDDRPTEREFCGNGLFFADRTPTPKLQEVRFLYQPVRIEPDAGGVTLDNRALFANTDRYNLKWRLLRDGAQVACGEISRPDVPAGEKRRFAIGLPEMTGGEEYVLHCGLYLAEATAWADENYELMHGWSVVRAAEACAHETAPVERVDGDYNIGMTDEKCRMLLSVKEGGMASLKARGGRELLVTVPALSFFRAPTDNDVANLGDRGAAFWQAVCTTARGEIQSADGNSVAFRYELPFANGAEARVRYTALGAGRVRVDVEYDGAEGLPDMSAFGLSLCLPGDINRVRYYGLGPDENYSDRRHGAHLGVFETTAARNLTPYLRPQECGSREGVRWLELTDAGGCGLRVEGLGAPLSVSVLPFSAAQLRAARHPDELPASCCTYLDVAQLRMGVGGDNTWGAPVHPEYHLPANVNRAFSFMIGIAENGC